MKRLIGCSEGVRIITKSKNRTLNHILKGYTNDIKKTR